MIEIDEVYLARLTHLERAYVRRVVAINSATSREDHDRLEREHAAWKQGVHDAGREVPVLSGDYYYIDHNIDRPMCCGVWLDWTPATVVECDICGGPHAAKDHRHTYDELTRDDGEAF